MEDKEKDLDNLEKLVEKEEKVTAHDMCSAEEEKVNEESEKKLTPEEEIEALWAERLHLTPPPYPERQQPPVAPAGATGRFSTAAGCSLRASASFRKSSRTSISRAGEGADAADTSCVVCACYGDVLPDTRYCGYCI